MIVFEVHINGKLVTASGVGEFGYLFAEIHWDKRDPVFRPKGRSKKSWGEEELRFRTIGGTRLNASSGEALCWPATPLSVGDKVAIRILERPECDEPTERFRHDYKQVANTTSPGRAKTKPVKPKRAKRRGRVSR